MALCMKSALCVVSVLALLLLPGCFQDASQDAAGQSAQGSGDGMTASERAAAAVAEAQENPSEEALRARDAAGELLARIGEKDKDLIGEFLSAAFFDAESCGIAEDAFIEGYFEGFSYEMGKVRDMADGTAEVEVYLTTFDGQQAVDALGEAYQQSLDSGEGSPRWEDVWGQLEEVSHGDPFRLVMAKDADGNWTVEDKASFGAALLGGFDPRQMAD